MKEKRSEREGRKKGRIEGNMKSERKAATQVKYRRLIVSSSLAATACKTVSMGALLNIVLKDALQMF